MRKLKLDELERLTVDEFVSTEKTPIIVVLDNIRSALNVGSIFRTSDAFAIEKIIICGISATPPNREINKTAIGATESVAWEYFESICDAIKKLKDEDFRIIGVEQTDQSILLPEFKATNEKMAVIFGNEVDGISDEILGMIDTCIEIPQFGTKHSLNVSVCAGIVLWELSKVYQ
ncbi:MAG: RNA methyltransferase [Saprospiraceae bacterium]